MNHNEECLIQHIAAAIELRLNDVSDSEFFKAVPMDISPAAIDEAAKLAFQRLCKKN